MKMDSFIILCLAIAIIGGAISGIKEMTDRSGYSVKSSKNIFTFLFCDKY
jgi:hypothetical protein